MRKDEEWILCGSGQAALSSGCGSPALRRQALELVACGDVTALRRLLAASSLTGQVEPLSGQVAYLRREVAHWATELSEAAVRGGMALEEACRLEEGFLEICGKAEKPESLVSLEHRMALEYARRVHELSYEKNPTLLMRAVADYVLDHLSQRAKVEDMARAFFMSRYYLSAKFKKEAGVSVTDYVLGLKVAQAKKLLREGGASITDIGCCLGFSSTSHFSHVFKAYVGQTPSEYRVYPNP